MWKGSVQQSRKNLWLASDLCNWVKTSLHFGQMLSAKSNPVLTFRKMINCACWRWQWLFHAKLNLGCAFDAGLNQFSSQDESETNLAWQGKISTLCNKRNLTIINKIKKLFYRKNIKLLVHSPRFKTSKPTRRQTWNQVVWFIVCPIPLLFKLFIQMIFFMIELSMLHPSSLFLAHLAKTTSLLFSLEK